MFFTHTTHFPRHTLHTSLVTYYTLILHTSLSHTTHFPRHTPHTQLTLLWFKGYNLAPWEKLEITGFLSYMVVATSCSILPYSIFNNNPCSIIIRQIQLQNGKLWVSNHHYNFFPLRIGPEVSYCKSYLIMSWNLRWLVSREGLRERSIDVQIGCLLELAGRLSVF